MSSFKLIGAALMLSAAFATPGFAQTAGLPELPGNYAFFTAIDNFPPSAAQPAPIGATALRPTAHPHRVVHHTRVH